MTEQYMIDEHNNCDNVMTSAIAGNDTDYVKFLGVFENTKDCIDSCVSYNGTTDRCETYTYYTSASNASSPFYKQCFGRFGYVLWIPVTQQEVNCGRIIYDCTQDLDCSLNGYCNNDAGKCECRKGWKGYHCEELNLLPANKNAGYQQQPDRDIGGNTSSWGGVPIVDYTNTNESAKYYMYVSELVNHCGIDSWVRNSRISLVQSTDGWNSKYERAKVLEVPFAHEPDVIYTNFPDGQTNYYVMYYAHYNYTVWNNLTYCNCSDGSTNMNECNNKHDNIPYNPYYQCSMIYSKTPFGPWSQPINIFNLSWNEPNGTHDNNFAAVILNNGSVVAMKRNWIHTTNVHGSLIHLVTAQNWLNNETYTVYPDVLFPELIQPFTEDPYLYLDCDGNFHAIFHNMDPKNLPEVCGGHAFSQDGINWIYGGKAYDNIFQFEDGTTFVAPRRERPHFLFDTNDKCTPIAATWGVVYGGMYGDASFTLIQPVNY